MRNSLIIIVTNLGLEKGLVVHFTQAENDNREPKPRAVLSHKNNGAKVVTAPTKLQGVDFNLVFPLSATTDIEGVDFAEIEKIMTLNGIAHNVTLIEKSRACGNSVEYKVTYNEAKAI